MGMCSATRCCSSLRGFPSAFIAAFFSGSLLIEKHLLARWPRPSLIRERAQARLCGRVRDALHLLAHGTCREPRLRLSSTRSLIPASISRAGGLAHGGKRGGQNRRRARCLRAAAREPQGAVRTHTHQPAALDETSSRTGGGYISLIVGWGVLLCFALCGVPGERPAGARQLQGRASLAGARRLPGI